MKNKIWISEEELELYKTTVKELIKELSKYDQDKIAVLTEPDLVGWDNIGQVVEDGSTIKISFDGGRED